MYALDFHVHHVGGQHQPPKNSTDEEVLAHAQQSRQVIVTSNHDMIMLCGERGASVVWLDPHGQRLRIDQQALMAFKGIDAWCLLLGQAATPVCLRVLRTKVHVLPVEDGAALAEKRYREIRQRQARKRAARPLLQQPLPSAASTEHAEEPPPSASGEG